ncbi:esterase-like activity of phytase family protein [Candidatus Thiodictyon syntrophicum]|jgi:hypothetical protein|uniref:Pyruvate-binding protein n=1 Tax=Candidatus Thiodictyon syntrophicum TaxID=1166950 RepID=A0A2K8UI93_9GAMM|nr:esterase-like activity of phytase family protein [Candidatus Thiodictyon syntrophicum]AUB85294.1 pyruvate-binding protein [Candidatus Thiodictyon syntrophicum]
MNKTLLLPTLMASALIAPMTHASPVLLAIGTLTQSAAGPDADLSGLTAPMENGVRGDLLGGIGSGLAYAGGNTFIATPDRGPNATVYNPLVDNTSSYIDRFQTIGMGLATNPNYVAGSNQPYLLNPTLNATTLMWSATALNYGDGSLGTGSGYTLGSGVPSQNSPGVNYFTGRSDNFVGTGSTNAANARFDPEAVRVSRDGRSLFVSDEYGPYVYQFDRATGERIRTFAVPGNLAVTTLGPTTAAEDDPNNSSGRVANKGMEGLAITPDGKTLVGIVQAAALQDKNKYLRIVTFDIASGQATHEYAYQLTTGSGVSDLVAVNDHEFLVDERDGKGLGDGSAAVIKQVFKIDITGATDVMNEPVLSNLTMVGKTAVAKSALPVVDLVTLLNAAGIASTDIPAKIEGLAFGPDLVFDATDYHTLFIANDNDFLPTEAGPNQFYVVGIPFSDLPGYQEQLVPAAPTLWLIGAGLLGLGRGVRGGLRRRGGKGQA